MNFDVSLSLCIPTNGVIEWVFPVLDSIFEEKNPAGNFEVIVTDNGNNEEFFKKMSSYKNEHPNLVYKKTDAPLFLNQIEAFKIARGKFIKFVNHRMKFLPGALNFLINYANENSDAKPVTFFMNDSSAKSPERCENFDEFVSGMSYSSSWSGGTAMWKEDFLKMDLSRPFNQLFPHIDMIFFVRDRNNYVINHQKLMDSIPTDETKKGKYNLFHAFAVEYPCIILELYRSGAIKSSTFVKIKKETLGFIAQLYLDYVILKKPCSYDISGYKNSVKIFFSHKSVLFQIPKNFAVRVKNKIFRMINFRRSKSS